MFGKRFTRALVVTTAGSLIMASAAFADDISNDLDTSVDAAHETLNLTAGGATGSTVLRVITQNGDGKNGCNLTGSTTLVTAVASSNTAVATVSPSSITWTSCDDEPILTVTPLAEGTATISLTQTSNSTAGTFSLAPATFTVNVAAAGDPCEAVSAPAAPVFAIDGADNDGLDGWFVTVPTVSAASSTAGATISYSTGGAFSATAPVLGQGITTVTARATSATCNKTTDTSTTFKIDTEAPVVTPGDVINTTWRNTSLQQAFSASDATSGLADAANDAGFTLTASAESANPTTPTTDSRTVYDNAGNSTTRSLSALIDLTDPTVSLVGGPAHGASYYFGSVPAAPTCSASDALSGLTAAGCVLSGYSTAVGSHTVTASAADNAGNSNSDGASYTVLNWVTSGFYSPVDMSTETITKVNTIKGGLTVPLKFEVFAGTNGANELTNTSIVSSFKTREMVCGSLETPVEDAIEITTTGGTSLRYDSTGGQFIQNWQTPKTTNKCYIATVTFQDGSSITAYFKTK